MKNKPFAIALVLLEFAIAVVVIVAATWMDRGSRTSGPEAPLVAYAAAASAGDVERAMGQLAPAERDRARPFVEWQAGNRHTLLASTVRTDSVLERLTGSAGGQTELSASLEIEDEEGNVWRTEESLPVRQEDGRWYLEKAPLEPAPN